MALDVGLEEEKARAFIELLSAGVEGSWAATERSRLNRGPCWFGSAVDLADMLVGEGWGVLDYFVPHPFEQRQRKFEVLVDPVQVVRVDLDPPAEARFEEQQAFVDECLEEIRLLLGEPTAVVDSGRGRWVYLKLSKPVSKEQARRLNQALHAFAKSEDPRSYNPAQWARLPGSVNEKTGHRAVVTEVEPTRLFDPVELELALSEFLPTKKQKAITGMGRDFQWSGDKLSRVFLPASPEFSRELQEYIGWSGTREESLKRWGRVRHAMEMRVLIALVRAGFTNLEIHAFAYQHGLARYLEEFEKKSWYGDHSVSKARKWVDEHPLPCKPPTTLPLTIERESAPPASEEGPDRSRKQVSHLKFFLLKEIDGSRPGEIYERMARKYAGRPGLKKRNLQNHVGFLIEEGLVDRVKGEDGYDRLMRTERGDRLAAKRFLPQVLTGYRMSAEGIAGRERAIETRRERERLMRLPPRVRQRDSVGARQRRIARNRYRTDFDGRLRLSFDGRQRIFYLQLITPSEHVEVVDLYRRIWVGFDEHGIPEYTSAISFSDPLHEGKELDDPARDRGLKPWAAGIGLGAFLTETRDGFTIASVPNRDGEPVPAAGLLVEDVNDFWLALWDAIPDPEGRILRVCRSGKWDGRSFSFEDVGEAIPLDGVPVPDLDEYLDEIEDPERLRALAAAQPEHSKLSYYPR